MTENNMTVSGSVEVETVVPEVKLAPLVEEKPKAPTHIQETNEIPQYRLNVFNTAGNIKQSISTSIYQDVSRRHGDIIRSLSSTQWLTMDELLEKVWQLEKKMRYPSDRTRKSVELAIKELIERELVSIR